MTPVDELALSKLKSKDFSFSERELKFLVSLVEEYLEEVYSGRRVDFPKSYYN